MTNTLGKLDNAYGRARERERKLQEAAMRFAAARIATDPRRADDAALDLLACAKAWTNASHAYGRALRAAGKASRERRATDKGDA